MLACEYGHKDIVKDLVLRGADNIVKDLILRGADINVKSGYYE